MAAQYADKAIARCGICEPTEGMTNQRVDRGPTDAQQRDGPDLSFGLTTNSRYRSGGADPGERSGDIAVTRGLGDRAIPNAASARLAPGVADVSKRRRRDRARALAVHYRVRGEAIVSSARLA